MWSEFCPLIPNISMRKWVRTQFPCVLDVRFRCAFLMSVLNYLDWLASRALKNAHKCTWKSHTASTFKHLQKMRHRLLTKSFSHLSFSVLFPFVFSPFNPYRRIFASGPTGLKGGTTTEWDRQPRLVLFSLFGNEEYTSPERKLRSSGLKRWDKRRL
jgi:hypothetical protein